MVFGRKAKWAASAVLAQLIFLSALLYSSPSFAVSAEEFYKNALAVNGINAFAATCQSAHETGFWTSYLWKSARNGAGIKADKNWRKSGRPSIKKSSREEVKGREVYRYSYFRVYSSLGEFLQDYRAKIVRDYPLAAKNSDTMWGYFSSLQKGRLGSWATTQSYFEHMADKAVRLAPKLLGVEWRAQMLSEYKQARAKGLLSQKEIKIVEKKLASAGISVSQKKPIK
ncbi:MAG: glucosaminidase domain-containing protein [Synergistaceae bacterium]|jgi:hypothetical protein|nr:glucosaminidase domain-containing protein [Synergistaceae bacterium]